MTMIFILFYLDIKFKSPYADLVTHGFWLYIDNLNSEWVFTDFVTLSFTPKTFTLMSVLYLIKYWRRGEDLVQQFVYMTGYWKPHKSLLMEHNKAKKKTEDVNGGSSARKLSLQKISQSSDISICCWMPNYLIDASFDQSIISDLI